MIYYRYKEVYWSNDSLTLLFHEYPVIKETPCGVQLDVFGRTRFVNKYSRKKFANPTKEEALKSYYARKKRQVEILSAQLRRAEAALKLTPDNETFFEVDWVIGEIKK